jgi:hypothetical protein
MYRKISIVTIVLLFSVKVGAEPINIKQICDGYASGLIVSTNKRRAIVECDCQCSDAENQFTVIKNGNERTYAFSQYLDKKTIEDAATDISKNTLILCKSEYKNILKVNASDFFAIQAPTDKPPYKCFEPVALVGDKIFNYKKQDVTNLYDGSKENKKFPVGTVNAAMSYIYNSPKEESKTRKYFIKNDSLQLLEEPRSGWVHVAYTKRDGSSLEGWLRIGDVKFSY